MTRYRKFALLASLYFSQGLPYGFFASALPTLLAEQGVSLGNIGLANLLALPWALKFLWAPVVDRHGSARFGWRRSWILPLQLVAILTLALLGTLDPTAALGLILVCILMTNLVAATQDIATDGLAVELLSSEDRGLGNGIQVGGYRVGMIVGGGLLLVIIGAVGWTWSFLAMAGVLAVASLPILFFKEPALERIDKTQPAVSGLLGSLSRPGIWLWLALLVIYKSGDAIASGMINPFLVNSGLSSQEVGWLSTLGSIASFVGAFAGGWGITRLGRRRGLLFFGLLQAVAVAGYVVAAFAVEADGQISYAFLAALSVAEHFTGTMATVALFTMMMDVCRPGVGATDYTLQASVVVIAQLGARSLSGFSADQLSHLGNFTLSAGLSLIGAVLAGVLLRSPSFRNRLLGPTESSW